MSKFLRILIHFLAINILVNETKSANRLIENFGTSNNRFEIESTNDVKYKLKDNIEEEENNRNENNKFEKRKENDDGEYEDYNETDNKKQNNTIFNNRDDDDESDFSDGPKEVDHNKKENIISGYDNDDSESNNRKQNITIFNDQDIDESDLNEGPKESIKNRKFSAVHRNVSKNSNLKKHIKRQANDDEDEYEDFNEQNNKQNKTISNDHDSDESDFNDGPKESHLNKMENPVSKSIPTIKLNTRNTDTINSFSNFIRNVKRAVIIGGENAHIGKYPWAVFLTGELEPGRPIFCGATIINRIWLLSAAHCFLSFENDELFNLTDPNKWSIQAGNVFVNIPENDRNKRSSETFNVLEIILHPLYNSEKLEYDIALIKMNKDFKLNYYKNKIDILNEEKLTGTFWPKSGQNCIFIGWGCTRPHGLVSERAQKVVLPVVDQNQCSTTYIGVYDKINQNHEFCAGYYDSDIGICSGDSGSGLVCIYNNKFYLAGIASGTSGAKPGRYPAIFTRVSYFYNWVKSTTEK